MDAATIIALVCFGVVMLGAMSRLGKEGCAIIALIILGIAAVAVINTIN